MTSVHVAWAYLVSLRFFYPPSSPLPLACQRSLWMLPISNQKCTELVRKFDLFFWITLQWQDLLCYLCFCVCILKWWWMQTMTRYDQNNRIWIGSRMIGAKLKESFWKYLQETSLPGYKYLQHQYGIPWRSIWVGFLLMISC